MADKIGSNILLTGLPRSGTTLVCHLLNKLPNSVALHEPMNPPALARMSDDERLRAIALFFEEQRRSIEASGTAVSKSFNGKVPDNPLDDIRSDGKRAWRLNGMTLQVSNVSGPGFRLYLKHPAFFSAYLPRLIESFDCFATVRNPLSVLLSWRNSGMPVSRGRAPAAEAFDDKLRESLDREPDVLSRQLILLDFFFSRYHAYARPNTIKYEDVVATRGKALARIDPAAAALDESLSSRNALALTSDSLASYVAERLLAREDAYWWAFYRREDVESLIVGANRFPA